MKRLLFKLLFKAVLGLALMVGISSYGIYLRGGDPAVVLHVVTGGTVGGMGERFGAAVDATKHGARRGLDGAGEMLGRDGVQAAGPSEVFRWTGADGVTHFATSAPPGIAATVVRVDPNVNVLAPVGAPRRVEEPATGSAAGGPARASSASGQAAPDESLPGVVGMLTGGPGASVDPAKAARVLRALQGQKDPR